MKRKFIPALLILAIMLAACDTNTPSTAKESYPYTANTVEIKSSPQKIISLSPALTETIYMLGYGGKIAGVSDYCDRPTAATEAASCGSPLAPDTKKIEQLGADLVISPTPIPEKSLIVLQQMNIPVVVIPRANSSEDILKNYETLSKALGGIARGQAADTQLRYYSDAAFEHIFSSMQTVSADKSAIYLRNMDFTIATGDTYESSLLTNMGFSNPAESHTNWAFPKEEEASLNPDVIFYASDISIDQITSSPYYKNTNAAKNNLLIPINPALFERLTPAMPIQLADTLQEAFPDAFTASMPSIVLPAPPEPEKELNFFEKLMANFKK